MTGIMLTSLVTCTCRILQRNRRSFRQVLMTTASGGACAILLRPLHVPAAPQQSFLHPPLWRRT